MRKVLMIMYMTLDGVAEVPDSPAVPDTPEDGSGPPMWTARMGSIDTLLLGRKTYDIWAAYWPLQKDAPDAIPFMKEFSAFADRAEKVVFSRTLTQVSWPNSRVVRSDPAEEVARLKQLPGGDMAVLGPRLVQSFLERDLIDEMHLQVYPSLAGAGKPLFRVDADPDHPGDVVPPGAPGRRDFRLVENKVLAGEVLVLSYRRVRPSA